MNKEELKQAFIDNLKGLLMDKEAQDDEEIVDFYMEVCCDIAEEYLNQNEDVIIKLTKEESRLLYGCLIRTGAGGEMLDVGEKVEKIIIEQLNNNDKNN